MEAMQMKCDRINNSEILTFTRHKNIITISYNEYAGGLLLVLPKFFILKYVHFHGRNDKVLVIRILTVPNRNENFKIKMTHK